MPKTTIMFWNLQRLGASTAAEIISGINFVARDLEHEDPETFDMAFSQHAKYDVELYCELTTACTVIAPTNLTFRHEKSAQLCYGAQAVNVPIPLTRIAPVPASTPSYQALGFDGGNNFATLCNRAPGLLAPPAGLLAVPAGFGTLQTYVFHAPAYEEGAARVLCFLAHHLIANVAPGTAWLVIGDLNCEPAELLGYDANLEPYIRRSGRPTYYSSTHHRYREFDYCLTNIRDLEVKVVRANQKYEYSDHRPIVAEYS